PASVPVLAEPGPARAAHIAPVVDLGPSFVEEAGIDWIGMARGAWESVNRPSTLAAFGVVYAYGAFLWLVLWGVRTAAMTLAARRALPLENDAVIRAAEQWADRFALRRTPPILTTDAVTSVCLVGVFRPKILVPNGLADTTDADDLSMMAAHELAHCRRRDPVLFATTAFIRAVFWFNPFIGAAASRLELAAEEGADALVLSGGADRRAYAACFVGALRYAAARQAATTLPLAHLSFTPFDRIGRRRRLKAILSPADGARLTRVQSAACLGGFAAATVVVFAQAALAVEPAHRDAAGDPADEGAQEHAAGDGALPDPKPATPAAKADAAPQPLMEPVTPNVRVVGLTSSRGALSEAEVDAVKDAVAAMRQRMGAGDAGRDRTRVVVKFNEFVTDKSKDKNKELDKALGKLKTKDDKKDKGLRFTHRWEFNTDEETDADAGVLRRFFVRPSRENPAIDEDEIRRLVEDARREAQAAAAKARREVERESSRAFRELQREMARLKEEGLFDRGSMFLELRDLTEEDRAAREEATVALREAHAMIAEQSKEIDALRAELDALRSEMAKAR
ncbi:MAG: M56 family metallopeptidase, partial [Pseudomonadota bacterium]